MRLYCECKALGCRSHGGPGKPCTSVGRFSSCRVRVNRRKDDLVLCKPCRENRGPTREA